MEIIASWQLEPTLALGINNDVHTTERERERRREGEKERARVCGMAALSEIMGGRLSV